MTSAPPLIERAYAWLAAWQRCIRERDYAMARALFSEDVIAFGTVEAQMSGLDALVHRQWMKVWENTRDFEFDLNRCAIVLARGDHCVIVVQWTSIAMARGKRRESARSGRASIVLRDEVGTLRCIHTHFSIDPAPQLFCAGAP
ncbi:MAG: YybH family protein [Panacagrimonas sp.]